MFASISLASCVTVLLGFAKLTYLSKSKTTFITFVGLFVSLPLNRASLALCAKLTASIIFGHGHHFYHHSVY